jgi:hypothetical protein
VNVLHCIKYPEKDPLSIAEDVKQKLKKEYFKFKEKISNYEQLLLRTLKFDINVETPYRYLMNYIKVLNETQGFAQFSWMMCSDSFRSDVSIHYKANEIAASVIYLTETFFERSTKKINEKYWYEVFGYEKERLEGN